MTTTLGEGDFDAVIVGSGAGGGTVAAALTEAGLTVCVLEKGPHYVDADFFHDELAVCRRSFFTPDPFTDPNAIAVDGAAPVPSGKGWISCCVGGGTVHMSGWMFRLHADDFRVRSRFGALAGATVADWPFDLPELTPYYDEIERRIGVSGDGPALPPAQRRALPLGPIAQHPAAALIDAAARRRRFTPFQTPRAILSGAYQGRAPCHYCGFCASYGCEVGAKSSTLSTLIPAAAATGKLTLVPHAMVLRVVADGRGRAREVVWRDGAGADHRARGRVVVVAGGAVQSARLLLASELANASGQLGRNLVLGAQGRARAYLAAPHASFAASGRDFPFIDRSVQDLYVAKDRGLPHPKAGTLVFLLHHQNPIYRAEEAADRGADQPPLWGAALTRRLRHTFRESRQLEVETFAEFFPHPGSHVTLDDKLKDPHGQPAARITTSLHPATAAATRLLVAEGRAVLADTGATVEDVPGDGLYWFLQAGTARMTKRAADGVVGSDGQAFDVPGLYVADGAPLPSAGAAPFTLTIMANALRIARGIAGRASRGEL